MQQRDTLLYNLACILASLASEHTGEARRELAALVLSMSEEAWLPDEMLELCVIALDHALATLRSGDDGSRIDAATIVFALYRAAHSGQVEDLRALWIFRAKD